ncbi:MAG: beta-propeller fold lactonase family protein [Burkholderiales bacterium]
MRMRNHGAAALLALCTLAPLPAAAQTGSDARLEMKSTIVDVLLRLANGSGSIGTIVDEIVPLSPGAGGALVPVPGALPDGCPAARSGTIHPSGRFIYMATDAGGLGNVCAFVFDPVARTLKPIPGTPFRAGLGTRAVAIDPAGRFVYAANFDTGNVSGFEVDATTGALTPTPGSPYAAGAGTRSVVVDPSGRFVYAANSAQNGSLAGFAISRDTGALATIVGSPYVVEGLPGELAIDPRGRYLYAGGASNQAFAINAANGSLARIGAGFGPPAQGLAVDPTGRFLFASSGGGDASRLTAYRINIDGSVAAVGPGVPAGDHPLGVAADRTGRYVYTANSIDGNVSGFRYHDVTGELTPIDGSPFPGSANTSALATSGWLSANASWPVAEYLARPLGVAGGRPPYFWTIAAGVLPPGLAISPDIGVVSGKPTTTGTYSFTARVMDGTGATATGNYTFTVTGITTQPVIEFHNAALDHYFITWRLDEIATLDAGDVIKGWKRTGKSFNAYTSTPPGSSPICRFYIPPALGDSHFFGRGAVECSATAAKNPGFTLEDGNFMQMILPIAGACPAGTAPVYRVFSNRADANHRYTTERAVRDAMAATGWQVEGDGPDFVVMCAP